MTESLNTVYAVTATIEPEVFIVDCNITDVHGDTYDAEYCSRPEDAYGLNPEIRQWLADNPDFPVDPYVPPTDEEMRANAPSITAKQLRMQIVADGFSTTIVDDAIAALPDGSLKEAATISWEYGTVFNRLEPLVTPVIRDALGYSEEQMDVFWEKALRL
ncbi:hypothetical protein V3589_15240 [Sinorhizobium fredii]|uniref:hypothetical protein n=1 Tax=Rhizobium fredii TaxID=380 RepID=UPI0030B1FF9C